ncbi:hypothetical protein CM9_02240 [Mycoplasmoides genitalium M2321]|nr:hypothetical protein CM9_02240 [Mycoplasmoides genitalium M2321]
MELNSEDVLVARYGELVLKGKTVLISQNN